MQEQKVNKIFLSSIPGQQDVPFRFLLHLIARRYAHIPAHEVAVHADEIHWQSVGQKLLLDLDGVDDDLQDAGLGRFVDHMLEHQTGEVAVESFVAGNQLVTEGQA